MFDQLSAEILASLIKGFPRTRTTTTKQNVDPAVYYVYSQVKNDDKLRSCSRQKTIVFEWNGA
jgi:hypothetical protein